MKLAKITLEIFQALFFCVAVACSTAVIAADNTIDEGVSHQLVDINSADAETIAANMDGVGLVKAQAIVAFREQLVGSFKTLEQLLEVKGIGEETLEKNRHKLTIVAK